MSEVTGPVKSETGVQMPIFLILEPVGAWAMLTPKRFAQAIGREVGTHAERRLPHPPTAGAWGLLGIAPGAHTVALIPGLLSKRPVQAETHYLDLKGS